MPTLKIHKQLRGETYFLTFTVTNWIDIFTDSEYFEVIINALKYYQKILKLKLYGYVILSNHMHLIAQSPDMIAFVRQFKSFTDRNLKELIRTDSRSYLKILIQDRVWRSYNWPVLIDSGKFFEQKLNYIHENPVRKGLVKREEDWLYSSARNYYLNDNTIINIAAEKLVKNQSLEPTFSTFYCGGLDQRKKK